MSNFNTAPGEQILVQGQCLDMNNPLAYKGILTVTNQRVHFRPTAINRALGAGSWEIAAVQLERVELAGLKKVLTIAAGHINCKLMGKDVLILFERLKSLVDEIHGGTGDDTGFESNESILLQGDVSLELNRFISTKGHITITTDRIRFQPKRTLESMLWRGTALEAPLTSITSVRLSAVRKRLELVVGGKHRAYQGALIPRLYGMLKILIQDGPDNLLGNWPCSLHRGPLAQRGELFATSQRFLFYPTGALDAMTGASKEISISVSRIDRMVVTRVEERLVVTSGKFSHQFTVANPADRIMELMPSLIYTPADDEPPVTGDACAVDMEKAQEMLAPWVARMAGGSGSIKLCGPAIQLMGGVGIRRGILFLCTERVIFAPTSHDDVQQDAIVMNLAALMPPGEDEEPGNQLRLTADSMTMNVFPRGEAAFSTLFWEFWSVERGRIIKLARKRLRERKREPIGPQDDYNRRQAFRLVFSQQRRAYLHIPHLPSGKGVLAPQEEGDIASESPSSNLLQVMEDGEGLTPAAGSDSNENADTAPESLASLHVDLAALPQTMVIGRATNICERGACILSPVELAERQEIFVQFDRNFIPGRILALVIHVKQVTKREWRIGLEFLDLASNHVLTIRGIVMEAQREELRSRSEYEID